MTNRMSSCIGATAVLLLTLGGGCRPKGEDCTLMGCPSALQIDFMPRGASPWPDGPYTVEVTADNQKGSCEITLPLVCGRMPPCTGTRSWMVADTGCAGPPSGHRLSGVFFPTATPAVVNVLIFRADEILGEETFQPMYQSSHPNGEDCDPTCRTAAVATMPLQL